MNELLIKMKNLKSIISIQNRLYNLLIHYSYEYISLPIINITVDFNSESNIRFNILQMEKYIDKVDIINNKLLYNFNNPPVYTNEPDIFDDLLKIFYIDEFSSNIDVSDISDNTDLLI